MRSDRFADFNFFAPPTSDQRDVGRDRPSPPQPTGAAAMAAAIVRAAAKARGAIVDDSPPREALKPVYRATAEEILAAGRKARGGR